ncbi:MAG: oligosaccharide flippase family protein [Clostridia bacterium]|nr:oligosaccharide flippase family protein [Clostridia bacterium]
MRIKNSIKNISTGIVGQMILLVTSFVTRTVFINILGSTYLGVSGLFSNILSLLSLAELGVGQAITFSLYKPIAESDSDKINSLMTIYKKIYRYIFVFVLVAGISLAPFLEHIIKDFNKVPHLTTIYILYVINSASSYLFVYRNTLITASQKNYVVHQISYIFSILLMVIQLLVLVLFKNYFVYLITQICIVISQNVVTAIVAGKMYPELDTKTARKLESEEKESLVKNIKSLMIYKVGSLLLNATDNILISAFVGVVKVGMYSNYTLTASSATGFLSTICSNLTASIGNLNAVETKEKKIEMFNIINLATFWLYGVCSVCIFCVSNAFITAWIGKEYLLSYRELSIIVLNTYVAGMLFAPFNYRQTMGLFVYGKMRPIISAIINMAASIILGRKFGLEGILWGTIIARVTTNVWFDPYIVFKKGLDASPKHYFFDYLIKLIIFMATGALAFAMTCMIPGTNMSSVIIKAMVAFIISNAIFLLIYARSSEFNYLKTVAMSFLKRKG